jgi:hypothetical protein
MEHELPIPEGAEAVMFIVDADPEAFVDGIEAWQQRVIESKKAEGITITHVEGANVFHGYRFPDPMDKS